MELAYSLEFYVGNHVSALNGEVLKNLQSSVYILKRYNFMKTLAQRGLSPAVGESPVEAFGTHQSSNHDPVAQRILSVRQLQVIIIIEGVMPHSICSLSR